jgi:predicted nucleic acid-binding protein
MSAKTFVDTNILIYACDVDEGEKHRIARDLLAELLTDEKGFSARRYCRSSMSMPRVRGQSR